MFHSVTINGKNSWINYHMVPVDGIYLPPPPEQKITTIDLKTGNGVLDTSTLLTGYPIFQNRGDQLRYYILEPWEIKEITGVDVDYPDANTMYSILLNDLHATKGTMIFEDDPDYYYEGKFYVSSFDTNTFRRMVVIRYEVKPYKMKTTATTYVLNGLGSSTWAYTGALTESDLGTMPLNPVVTITGTFSTNETVTVKIQTPDESGSYTNAGEQIKVINDAGNYRWADFLIYKKAKLCFLGASDKSVTWTFNQGRL